MAKLLSWRQKIEGVIDNFNLLSLLMKKSNYLLKLVSIIQHKHFCKEKQNCEENKSLVHVLTAWSNDYDKVKSEYLKNRKNSYLVFQSTRR